jgi:erythromycin esterase-like protein
MYRLKSVSAIFLLVGLPVFLSPLKAQQPDLSEYLSRNAKELILTNNRLGGPGAGLLREEASRSQFIFLGEEHGIAEIPQFTAALWRELVPLGYRHVALEQGPWIISQADRYVRFGDIKAMKTYRESVVPLLHFDSEESLAFFDALRPLSPKAKTAIVWGLDQEMRATPLLRRLLQLAPNHAARQVLQPVLARAERADKPGKSSLLGFQNDIAAIRRSFGRKPSAEAAQILDYMEISNRIYENNQRANSEPTGYESNREREDMMKDLFLQNYRAARRVGERTPKVLLQLGAWHGTRGLSPTNVASLGNFLAEFARGEGSQMFNLAITCGKGGKRSGVNEDAGKELPCGADEAEWARPLLKAAKWRYTLFDLRPLRPIVYAQVVKTTEPLSSIIFQYDALLIINNSTAMHVQR